MADSRSDSGIERPCFERSLYPGQPLSGLRLFINPRAKSGRNSDKFGLDSAEDRGDKGKAYYVQIQEAEVVPGENPGLLAKCFPKPPEFTSIQD
jgi:hypothetical protein